MCQTEEYSGKLVKNRLSITGFDLNMALMWYIVFN